MVLSMTGRSVISKPRARIVTSTGIGFGLSIVAIASVPLSSGERRVIAGVIWTVNGGAPHPAGPRTWMRVHADMTARIAAASPTAIRRSPNHARHDGQRPIRIGTTTPQAGQDVVAM